MPVTAPPGDTVGAALLAQIAALQAVVTANANPRATSALAQQLVLLQTEAVDRFMTTSPTVTDGSSLGPAIPPLLALQYLPTVIGGLPLSPIADFGGQDLDGRLAKMAVVIAEGGITTPQQQQVLTALQQQAVDHHMARGNILAAAVLAGATAPIPVVCTLNGASAVPSLMIPGCSLPGRRQFIS